MIGSRRCCDQFHSLLDIGSIGRARSSHRLCRHRDVVDVKSLAATQGNRVLARIHRRTRMDGARTEEGG